MASSKREKELARQRAERQAARRAAAAQRKRQRQAVVASVVAVLLVATAAIAAAMSLGGGDPETPDVAAPAVTASAEPTAEATEEPAADPAVSAEPATDDGDPGCEYIPTEQPATREVTFPPTEGVETEKVYNVTLTTNQGEIVFEMDSAEAPCTANNFRSLTHFKYFENTPCHRLTTEGISVLQCGSPDGSGNGGPGYTFKDENLEGATYERGTVAMANSGPATNGSQFFLVYEDSALPPNYTPFGTIVSGLDVLEKIAAAGSDESNGVGDGKPNLPVVIEKVRAREKTS